MYKFKKFIERKGKYRILSGILIYITFLVIIEIIYILKYKVFDNVISNTDLFT